MDEKEQLYAKGFNAGYLLSKEEPALLKQLLKSSNNESAYIKGLNAGSKQWEKELLQEKLQTQSRSKDRDLER